jgi:uncharacterized lipoprotein YajG
VEGAQKRATEKASRVFVLCGCEASERSQQTTKDVSIVSTEFLRRNIPIFVNDKDRERKKNENENEKIFVFVFVEP